MAAAAPPKRRPPPYVHALAGISAGACSTTLLYPLDLVKVRFQADTRLERMPGVLQAASKVVRKEGVRALFNGLTPALLGSALSWGGFFYFYERFKPEEAGAVNHAVASIQSGACMVLLTNPVWLVKTRLQLQRSGQERVMYRGVGDAFRRIVKEEGWLALYRGILPALLLTSHGAVQFVVYEKLKSLRPPSTDYKAEALVYGALSKLAAATATYPYQVVKTRVQQRYPASQRFVGNLPAGEVARTFRAVADTYRIEGARGFFKGCWPNALRVAPSAALTFWTYEVVVAAAGAALE
jgi:solute carrier family 25 folate transporter 32